MEDKNSDNQSQEQPAEPSRKGAQGDAVAGLSGRDLDAAVAERVMGFTRAPTSPHPTDNRAINGVIYYLPDTPWDRNQQNVVPYFSSDIAAAWQIMEHFQKQGCMVSVHASSDKETWWGVIYPPNGEHVESPNCASAPEAICRAALLALAFTPDANTPS